MEEKLLTFHRYKRVFRPYRATPAARRRRTRAWQRILHEREEQQLGELTERQQTRLNNALDKKYFHFSFIKMHLPSHIGESIKLIGLLDNFTTDISEHLHIRNIKDAYKKSNRVDYIKQMLFYNDRALGLEYMSQALRTLALQGYGDEQCARVLGLQSQEGKHTYSISFNS